MKKRIMIYLGMLVMFTTCLFLCGFTSEAKEQGAQSISGAVQVQEKIMNTYDDIPSEIKDPVEKGKHLVCYLVIALGAVVAIAGGIMLGTAWISHQQDMQVRGFIFFFVGIFFVLLPIIINWLVPKANLL